MVLQSIVLRQIHRVLVGGKVGATNVRFLTYK
jgi:hypothetical protein